MKMKRTHYLLLLSTLLSQTTPIWAMEEDGIPQQQRRGPAPAQLFEVDGDIIRPAQGNPQARFRDGVIRELLAVQHIRYEAQLQAGLQLNPDGPLPQILGHARQRVRCLFQHEGRQQSCEFLRPIQYALQAEDLYIEDRDHRRDVRTLRLRTTGEDQQLKDVYQDIPLQAFVSHTHIRNTGPERVGRRYFDGDTVYLGRIVPQEWRNRTGTVYASESGIQEQGLPNHPGGQIIYVEPFAIGNDPVRQRDYRGGYDFVRDLALNELLQGREPVRLIYSDGNHVYFPHVTQELWQGERGRVGFCIASYNADRRLHFVRNHVLNGRLEQGLYQLSSVQEEANRRLERWTRLGDNPHQVEITGPAGVASLPGIGAWTPREVPPTNAAPQIVQLQTNMERSAARMQEIARYIAAHPHVEGLDVIIGPAGSGKSILAHLLAQRPLEARRVPLRGIRLDTDNRLPGFVIGHQGQAGTTFPAVWYDDVHNRFIADCPGFGDPEGADRDILNVFSIHRLLANHGNIKVVMTIKEEEVINRSGHLVKLLNDVTGFFQNDGDLRNNLSFVVTHQRRTQPHEFVPLLQQVLHDIQGINPRSRALLEFLSQNPNRISSIPEADREGPFNFNIQPSQGAIENSRYVVNPSVRMGIRADAGLLVSVLGQNLNNYLTNYMRTEGSQRIINFCRSQIDTHDAPIDQLRASLANVVRDLRALQQVPANEPERFVDGLRRFMNVDDVTRTIGQIDFLRNLREDVIYQPANWANALLGTIEKIEHPQMGLIAFPQSVVANGFLWIRSVLLGTSEIQAAMAANPGLSICVQAWNSLFIDQNIQASERSFYAFAPRIRVVGERTIDLSGLPGRAGAYGALPGADGQPGGPGGNSGHAYMRAFEFLGLTPDGRSRLTLFLNGGAGGQGGNGTAGANGKPGRDGNLAKVTRFDTRTYDGGVANVEMYREDHSYYEDRGTDGTPGQNGGRAGAPGLGGHPGTVHFERHDGNAVGQAGATGIPGQSAVGGQGGVHGKHCIGHVGTRTLLSERRRDGRGVKHPSPNVGRALPYGAQQAPAHQDRGRAPNGATPAAGLVNPAQSQPPAQPIPLNPDPLVQDYKIHYIAAASDPQATSFVKSFPGLPEGQ